jgi:hypothetical protein
MKKQAEREAKAEMLRERQTARGLLAQAREFHKAAELIANQVGTDEATDGLSDRAYHNPFYYLCAHSLELSMKAAILSAGMSHEYLTRIGHDLDGCLSEMRRLYPEHQESYDEHSEMISILNKSYVNKEFEYRLTGPGLWPTVFPLLYVVDEFCCISYKIIPAPA